jgi:phage/plasmid-associated DNA primase
MFRKGSVGTINSTHEPIFGYEELINKEVILAPDLPINLSAFIKDDILKGMADGGDVSIPRKNRTPLIVPWHVPTLFIGQDYPDYKDVGGAMYKRFAFFNFENQVPNDKVDTTLKDYIIKNELSSILYKAIKYYKDFIKGCNKTFENIRPKYFNENGMTFVNDNNSLYEFLNSPESKDKMGNTYILEYGKEHSIELNKLMGKYKSWCKFTGSQYDKKFDISTFNQMDLEIINKRICTSCRKDHKVNCCNNYSPNRVTKFKIVEGIKYSIYQNGEEYLFHDIEEDL